MTMDTDEARAPHGWVWLDDDGWEHDPDPQHPRERGEAQFATDFRPATAEEAASPDFFRCPKVVFRFGHPADGAAG